MSSFAVHSFTAFEAGFWPAEKCAQMRDNLRGSTRFVLEAVTQAHKETAVYLFSFHLFLLPEFPASHLLTTMDMNMDTSTGMAGMTGMDMATATSTGAMSSSTSSMGGMDMGGGMGGMDMGTGSCKITVRLVSLQLSNSPTV